MTEAAKKARREYQRAYYAKTKEKQKEYRENYWARKAAESRPRSEKSAGRPTQ